MTCGAGSELETHPAARLQRGKGVAVDASMHGKEVAIKMVPEAAGARRRCARSAMLMGRRSASRCTSGNQPRESLLRDRADAATETISRHGAGGGISSSRRPHHRSPPHRRGWTPTSSRRSSRTRPWPSCRTSSSPSSGDAAKPENLAANDGHVKLVALGSPYAALETAKKAPKGSVILARPDTAALASAAARRGHPGGHERRGLHPLRPAHREASL